MATAIGKLGFVAYPAGWGFALQLLGLLGLLPHLLHLVLVRFKLLVQLPAGEWEGQRLEVIGDLEDECWIPFGIECLLVSREPMLQQV